MIKTLPEYLNSIENKLDELITLLTPKEVEKEVLVENNNKKKAIKEMNIQQIGI